MTRLTNWFPPHIKPKHVGVYNASYCKAPNIFRFWDGKYWTWGWTEKDSIKYIIYAKKHLAVDLHIHWRGLADEPMGDGNG